MNAETQMAKLKTLYPDLSAEDLLLAKDALDRYLLLAWEIYEDLRGSEDQSIFDSSPPRSNIRTKGRFPK